jgi:hypothetical protein
LIPQGANSFFSTTTITAVDSPRFAKVYYAVWVWVANAVLTQALH